jgi:hypothetical protein
MKIYENRCVAFAGADPERVTEAPHVAEERAEVKPDVTIPQYTQMNRNRLTHDYHWPSLMNEPSSELWLVSNTVLSLSIFLK